MDRRVDGRESSSSAHHDDQSRTIATSARVRAPATAWSDASSAPSASTSCHVRVRGPACGSIAECHFSAPPAAARHWKCRTASAPRATCWSDQRRYAPPDLGGLTLRQLMAETACSISSHGWPSPSDRMRSAPAAPSTWERGSARSGYQSSLTTSSARAQSQ